MFRKDFEGQKDIQNGEDNHQSQTKTQQQPFQQQLTNQHHKYYLTDKEIIEESDKKYNLPSITKKQKKEDNECVICRNKKNQINLPRLCQQSQQNNANKKKQSHQNKSKITKQQIDKKNTIKNQNINKSNDFKQNIEEGIKKKQNENSNNNKSISTQTSTEKVQNKEKNQRQYNKSCQQNVIVISKPQNILQTVLCFDPSCRSQTIKLEDKQNTIACQNSFYYQNHKLILTQPIKSTKSICKFKVQNIKYCVGFGVAIKEVILRHQFDYQSQGTSQLSHGLYIITSQGYSWSHSQKEEDDIFRLGFNQMYTGLIVEVHIQNEEIYFKYKKGQFKLTLPNRIRQKYALCFCAYLHQKLDSVSIIQ